MSMTDDTLYSYCCDTSADGGECLCAIEKKQEAALPEHWKLVRKTMLPGTWLVAEKRGIWVHLFTIVWNEEGEVWNSGPRGKLLDLWEGDLEILQNMLKS